MHVPTREAFAAIAERARLAGRQAALKMYEELSSESDSQNFYGEGSKQMPTLVHTRSPTRSAPLRLSPPLGRG